MQITYDNFTRRVGSRHEPYPASSSHWRDESNVSARWKLFIAYFYFFIWIHSFGIAVKCRPAVKSTKKVIVKLVRHFGTLSCSLGHSTPNGQKKLSQYRRLGLVSPTHKTRFEHVQFSDSRGKGLFIGKDLRFGCGKILHGKKQDAHLVPSSGSGFPQLALWYQMTLRLFTGGVPGDYIKRSLLPLHSAWNRIPHWEGFEGLLREACLVGFYAVILRYLRAKRCLRLSALSARLVFWINCLLSRTPDIQSRNGPRAFIYSHSIQLGG